MSNSDSEDSSHSAPSSQGSFSERDGISRRSLLTRGFVLGTAGLAGSLALLSSRKKREVPDVQPGDQARRMLDPNWNALPADLTGIIVLYDSKLDFPQSQDTNPAPRDAGARMRDVLKLDAAKDDQMVLTLTRAFISGKNQRQYERRLGSVAERVTNPERPSIVFDYEREQVEYKAREIRKLLADREKEKSEEHNEMRQPKEEKGKMLAAVLNALEGNLFPAGLPKGYRAISSANQSKHRLLPGDLPKVPPEQVVEALDQIDSNQR